MNAGTGAGTDRDRGAGTDTAANNEQAELWNGIAGRGWVEAQQVMDDLLRPFETRLLEELAAVMDESPVRTL